MSIDKFLTELRKTQNIIVSRDGEDLKVHAPEEALNSAVLAQIKERKPEILQFFKSSARKQTIRPSEEKEFYRLSSSQKRIYFAYEFDTGSIAYNIQNSIRLVGRLDQELLEKSFNQLVSRHEILRTIFLTIDGHLVQRVLPTVPIKVERLLAEEVDAVLMSRFVKPFDLGRAPLLRVGLVQKSEKEHILIVDVHHIVTDGVSQKKLLNDLIHLYNGEQLPEIALQYKDYAEWQYSPDQQQEIEKQKSFWVDQFSEGVEVLELPTDFDRAHHIQLEADSVRFTIGEKETEALNRIARDHEATLFMVLLSIYYILLSKISNQENIVVGTPIAGRHHSDLDKMIGVFINSLALPGKPSGNRSYKDFLSEVKETVLNSYINQDYPYDALIDDLDVERGTSYNPLFNVMFSYRNFEEEHVELHDLTIYPVFNSKLETKLDLTLFAEEVDEKIILDLEYASNLFERTSIEHYVSYFQAIITSVTNHPETQIANIDILSARERNQLLFEFNATEADYPAVDRVLDLFDQQVQLYPDKIAVVDGETEISYQDLKQASQNLAAALNKAYPNAEVVALAVHPSVEVMIGILGILRAGKVFLPLDPEQQSARLETILQDCEVEILLVKGDLPDLPNISGDIKEIAELSSSVSTEEQKQVPGRDDWAYVIYTSGSTGTPKGVKVGNQNLINYIFWLKETLNISPESKSILTSSYSFDLGYSSIFPIICCGGELHLVSKQTYQQPEDLLSYITQRGITYLKVTPSLFTTLVRSSHLEAKQLESLTHIILGGEPIITKDVKTCADLAGHIKFVNHFGPTETTIGTIAHQIEDLPSFINSPTIGRPISNTQVHILDEYGQLVPPGTVGEICIAGASVGLGYYNRRELTEEKFINTDFTKNDRLYKTGDLGRWLADGNIELRGRVDDQVKINGFRVEPKEINAHLTDFKSIESSLILVTEVGEKKSLVVYYISAEEVDHELIRIFLSERLPEYMVPTIYFRIDRLPLTANGKLDRKALPDPELSTEDITVGPVSKEEKILADSWKEVLGLENLGVTDNFFAVGGDSIKSILISAKLRKLGYQIAVRDIFVYQTIQKLATELVNTEETSEQIRIHGTSKLTPIQTWFWEHESLKEKSRYNQSLGINFPDGLSEELVRKIFNALQEHHDALRIVFKEGEQGHEQHNLKENLSLHVELHDLRNEKTECTEVIEQIANDLHQAIDLEKGLLKLALCQTNEGCHLLIIIHHLIIDGVSWRILMEDFHYLYRQFKEGKSAKLPSKTDAFLKWPEQLGTYLESASYRKAKDYWQNFHQTIVAAKPELADWPYGPNDFQYREICSSKLDEITTNKLLTEVHRPFNTQINDVLLTALLIAFREECEFSEVVIDMEGHGRENVLPEVNIDRTVGWFTTLFPTYWSIENKGLKEVIKYVKETFRKIPNHGFDHLLYKYYDSEGLHNDTIVSSIRFNYLGQFNHEFEDRDFVIATKSWGQVVSEVDTNGYDLDVVVRTIAGSMEVQLQYSTERFRQERIESLGNKIKEVLIRIAEYCSTFPNQEKTPSDFTYKELSQYQVDSLTASHEIEDIYLLSPMQEGMLFHSRLDEKSTNYFEQKVLSVLGELNIEAVQKSFEELINRYDIFKTLFLWEELDQPVQVVLKSQEASFEYCDVKNEVHESSDEQVINTYVLEDRANTFNLSCDPLMRLKVLHLRQDEYVFIWSHHHILMDGWCMSIIVADFSEIYLKHKLGKAINLPAVKPYSTYIKWIHNWDKTLASEYWRNYLLGFASQTSVSITRDNKNSSGYLQRIRSFEIDTELRTSIETTAIKLNVTLNTFFQCAWALVLSKYSRSSDVVFGAVVSGRPEEIEGVESMIGLFINTIPVRLKCEPEVEVGDWLRSAQQSAAESVPYHYYPLTETHQLNELGRDLFDHIMVFENHSAVRESQQTETANDNLGFEISDRELYEQVNYDLEIDVIPGESLQVKFLYNIHVYDDLRIEQLVNHLINVLAQLSDSLEMSLGSLSILSKEEKSHLIKDFNDTHVNIDRTRTFSDIFLDQVKKSPDRIAVMHNETQLTYQDLLEKSMGLYTVLKERGIKPYDRVVVMMPRGIDMLVSMLACFHCGATYLPIDTEIPKKRIETIIDDSACSVLITTSSDRSLIELNKNSNLYAYQLVLIDEIESKASDIALNCCNEHHAYIIYTSGTTGKPKGAITHHLGLLNHLIALIDVLDITEEDIIVQSASAGFDISIWQFVCGLMVGAKISIFDKEDVRDPSRLSRLLKASNATIFQSVPSLISTYLDTWDEVDIFGLQTLRWLIPTGEPLNAKLVKKWFSRFPGIKLLNAYGPAECSDDVSTAVIDRPLAQGQDMVLGQPIQNMKIYLLDDQLNPCPMGVEGEICISGIGVGPGYWGDSEKTQKAFVFNPFSAESEQPEDYGMLYRTGDMGYRLQDGNIVGTGRRDHQIKIRGFRVELAEIESALLHEEEINDAVVIAKGEGQEIQLIGYYVSPIEFDVNQLNTILSERLPYYMIPGFFVRLDKLPVTINGKIDKAALPEPIISSLQEAVAPENDTEEKLAQLWAEVLDIDPSEISVNTSFFDIGGHSLNASVLINKINSELNVHISLDKIFERQTIKQQANYVQMDNWLDSENQNNGKTQEVFI